MSLPQHWIRDTQPHIYWCPFCERWVSKWHEHHGPRKKWKHSDPGTIVKEQTDE